MMSADIKLVNENNVFSLRSCAIIYNNNKVLFQKRPNDVFWALPGGKIKYNETSIEAIYRELNEELGIDNILKCNIIDSSEYFFKVNEVNYHQCIYTFEIVLSNYDKIDRNHFCRKDGECELVFKWFDIKEIDKSLIKPDFIKKRIKLRKKEKTIGIYREF